MCIRSKLIELLLVIEYAFMMSVVRVDMCYHWDNYNIYLFQDVCMFQTLVYFRHGTNNILTF